MSFRKPRWFILSNRLPYIYDPEKKQLSPGSGGLITAISGIKASADMIWIGSVPEEVPSRLLKNLKAGPRQSFLPVRLPADLYDSYYNGFCNDVLWPLFHYESEAVKFRQKHWESYLKVNQIFADVILKEARDEDLIWVHDFHFMSLPGMLHKKRPGLRVGFFLHIPFPSSEVFRQLPVREEILQSVIKADLIGFHDYAYLRHFSSSVYHVLGIHPESHMIEVGSHRAKLGVHPVSIDQEAFVKKASSVRAVSAFKKMRKDWHGLKIILGVDRLDYIKGIKLKLRAFQKLLEKRPELVGKVAMLQIAVPSRTDVAEYIQLRQEIEQLVGKINGQYSSPGYTPISYMFKSVDNNELMGMYQSSHVLFIGSKRDGLNLVSMEYVAVQNPRDPGVVVLSEFAGASAVLSHSILINPWDEEQTSDALARALEMPLAERKNAHQAMQTFLKSYTATDWATGFMKGLQSGEIARKESEARTVAGRQDFAEIRKSISAGGQTLVIDYDGTLTPIVSRPQDAHLPPEGLKVLKSIRELGVRVVILSGRPGRFLVAQFGNRDFDLGPDHGARHWDARKKKWTNLVTRDPRRWYPKALEVISDFAKRVPDSMIEQKEFAIVWHYRNSPADFGGFMARKLAIELEGAMAGNPVIIEEGKKIVEVKSMEANKGEFLAWLMRKDSADMRYLCVGDDKTDEDMFRQVSDRGSSVKVGSEATAAGWRLDGQHEVFAFLHKVFRTK